MLKKEEGTLAVLSLDGHVKQGLSIRHSVIDWSPWAQQLSCYGVHTWQTPLDATKITMQFYNRLTHSQSWPAALCTCPECQAQHRLVHGVLETEVWNDLEVVGGMKCIGCNRAKKRNWLIYGCLSDDVHWRKAELDQHNFHVYNLVTGTQMWVTLKKPPNLFAQGWLRPHLGGCEQWPCGAESA